MKWQPFRFFSTLSLVVLCIGAVRAQDVLLKGDRWLVSIQPQTLQVTGTPLGGQPLTLSLPRPSHGPVADLKHDGRQARWGLPREKLTVDMRLNGDALLVQFTATEPGSFTWPVLGPDPSVRAYILPLFEGLYVPVDDPRWADFLLKQGVLDTTSGLSMPFWGIDCGGCTLTYIVTNPFNNELAFRRDDGKLTAQLTHTFTPNRKVKQYGLRICLAAPCRSSRPSSTASTWSSRASSSA